MSRLLIPSLWLLMHRRCVGVFMFGVVCLVMSTAPARAAENSGRGAPGISDRSPGSPVVVNLAVPDAKDLPKAEVALKVLFAMTLLAAAPSIILLMTCFTRIVIVLSFLRSAMTLPGTPSNQIIIGLALFLTLFIMAPVWERVDRDALQPYQSGEITGAAALDAAKGHVRTFLLRQTRPKDVEFFVSLAQSRTTSVDQLPLRVAIPAFLLSELRTAFQMGFLLFIPFILIDLVVATVLMSMGMMMMPPMSISLPLKILLFVLVDGWTLVVRSLVQSFT